MLRGKIPQLIQNTVDNSFAPTRGVVASDEVRLLDRRKGRSHHRHFEGCDRRRAVLGGWGVGWVERNSETKVLVRIRLPQVSLSSLIPSVVW